MEYPISIGYLRECFDFDAVAGMLTWKRRPREHFGSDRQFKIWNTQFSGRKAGSASGDGYIRIGISVRGKVYHLLAHRAVWGLHYGSWPVGDLDHIDGNRSSNGVCNLRDATRAQNSRNSKMQRNNKLGLKGIYANRGRYEARLTVDGKSIYLGSHSTPELAHAAYGAAALKHHGAFARKS